MGSLEDGELLREGLDDERLERLGEERLERLTARVRDLRARFLNRRDKWKVNVWFERLVSNINLAKALGSIPNILLHSEH